jgi:hypothetical protein
MLPETATDNDGSVENALSGFNSDTIEAIKEARNSELPSFDSVDALMAELNGE